MAINTAGGVKSFYKSGRIRYRIEEKTIKPPQKQKQKLSFTVNSKQTIDRKKKKEKKNQ